MSTPLAMVSPSVPGIRGFTSSSAGRPARSRRHWTLATYVRPVALATARPNSSISGSWTVRPPTETPESTRARIRGTEAMTWPPASARTSTEYSSPGRNSCTIRVDERLSAASSAAEPISRMPREPLPVRGLTMTGYVQLAGSTAEPKSSVRGTRTTLAQCCASSSLSRMTSSAAAGARSSSMPAAANSARACARGRSSASTVGSTMSTSSAMHRPSSDSAKSGAAPGGISVRAAGGTRYRPAAQGSMSAARSSTELSARSDFMAAIAAGPPAPVTSRRSGLWPGRSGAVMSWPASGCRRAGPAGRPGRG